MMASMLFCNLRSIFIILAFLAILLPPLLGFSPARFLRFKTSVGINLSISSSNNSFDAPKHHLKAASKVPLLWETIQARESKPVLNLSNVNNIDNLLNDNEVGDFDLHRLEHKQHWNSTRSRLQEMNLLVLSDEQEEKILEAVPQLLRLDTDIVVNSCQAIMDLFDHTNLILQQPQLLSFRGDDLRYGVEFLSIMMACSREIIVDTCRDNPKLLVGGVEGGLQEQAVKRALSSASDATSKANKHIAANAAASLSSLKERKKRPPGIQ